MTKLSRPPSQERLETPLFYGIKDAARLAGLSESTMRRLILDSLQLPWVRLGCRIMVPADALMAWLLTLRSKAQQDWIDALEERAKLFPPKKRKA